MAMNRLLLATWVAACNTAPLAYDDLGVAPGAKGEWGTPSDAVCLERDDPDAVQVGAFLLCGTENRFVPVDDPIIERCDRAALLPADQVFYVFDGVMARAYLIDALSQREIVHDEWGQVPILVDW